MSSFDQLAFAVVLAVVTPLLVATSQESATVQGAWTLNRDLTPAPPKRDDDVRRPEGRRPPGGGGGFPGTTAYERLTSDGESRLQVTLQIEGLPEGPGGRGDQGSRAPITRIYDAGKQAP